MDEIDQNQTASNPDIWSTNHINIGMYIENSLRGILKWFIGGLEQNKNNSILLFVNDNDVGLSLPTQDKNGTIENEELNGFLKDLMELVQQVRGALFVFM